MEDDSAGSSTPVYAPSVEENGGSDSISNSNSEHAYSTGKRVTKITE